MENNELIKPNNHPEANEVEEWRIIPSYPYYEASSFGCVRHIGKKNCLTPKYHFGTGYPMVHLRSGVKNKKNGEYKYVHRLVGEAFLGEMPEGKTQIDHIDRDRTNNYYKNLRWVNSKENWDNRKPKEEFRKKVYKNSTPIVLLNWTTGNVIKEYSCINEASEDLGYKPKNIARLIGQDLGGYRIGKFITKEEYLNSKKI